MNYFSQILSNITGSQVFGMMLVCGLSIFIIFLIKKNSTPNSPANSDDTKPKKSLIGKVFAIISQITFVLVLIAIIVGVVWFLLSAYHGINGLINSYHQKWQTVGEISYAPDHPGWTLKELNIPPGLSKCKITCQRGYEQFYTDLNGTGHISCDGRTMMEVTPKYKKFAKAAQLIKVDGTISAATSTEFDCDNIVRASFMPNMQETSENFDKNRGRPLFFVEKLQNPKS